MDNVKHVTVMYLGEQLKTDEKSISTIAFAIHAMESLCSLRNGIIMTTQYVTLYKKKLNSSALW